MKREKSKRLMQDCRGFSLIEVLLGISVFMIGMLGVTALNISSLKSNTFSGNLSEATLIGATKIEELMAQDFDDILDTDGDGVGQDDFDKDDPTSDDGIDDDDDADATNNVDGRSNFGLDDIGYDDDPSTDLDADGSVCVDDLLVPDPCLGKNNIYSVYYNVAENEPISVSPQRTKTINVIVEWHIKDEPRRISMDVIRMKEE